MPLSAWPSPWVTCRRRSARCWSAYRTTCSTWAPTWPRLSWRNPEYPPLRVEQSYIDKLEADCDTFLEELEKLRSFILPGGTPGAALLHQACTVVRRAERSTWAALEEHGDIMNPLTATYLNRLSDLLFILARTANKEVGDVLWVPGENR